ncbi:Transposase (or an inactivated derivative) [Singulisphaera sp. GP187]|uniref:IS256 family transposase n=1 Tax=Singulisphaera sp. GP187 TaxID=1882752 RepID=UPI0009299CCF|nr:IS256 family transposase [Singulisphaera sp. GP187]SIO63366.1 Transposase (or an inactivated derivative) [Singulisphaera sp. GP187]
MSQSTSEIRILPLAGSHDVLTEVLRNGAREMLARAIEAEVAAWIDDHAHLKDEAGRRQVVRNGSHPERTILTGLGPIGVKQPRVQDRRPPESRETFTPAVLPPYLRRTKSLDELIPWLYLKGISTGDFPEALKAILGPDAPGLSANTVTRLKSAWEEEHRTWSQRSLKGKQYVYVWADGVHFNIRLEEGRQCILVLMGATADGKKELIAIADGYRESEQSWKELLLDCKARGLEVEPHLAIGDGALGFWKAMRQVWDTTKEQRCWVHKTANVLDKLPKGSQPKAKGMLHEIDLAESRENAVKAFDLFLKTYEAKYPKATECLLKDRDVLLTFYDFPAEQWLHIRTTNPIESTFSTVRLRHNKTKGSGSRTACLTMVYKLMESASKSWRSLNGSELLREVIAGVIFEDGVKKTTAA